MSSDGPAIFISYRRSDSQAWAGRLLRDLEQRFGRGQVFRDLSGLGPGEQFTERIGTILAQARIVIVVIGKNWVSAADSGGARRLLDPQDLVRVEVSRALARDDVRVVPLLVDDAEMPDAAELPRDLKTLPERNGARISDATWDEDVERLARGLGMSMDSRRRNRLIIGLSAAASGGAAYVGSQVAGALFSIQNEPSRLTIYVNESVTFAFPAAGLAAVVVYSHRSTWSSGRTIGLAALTCAALTGLTIAFLWNAPFAAGPAYLTLLCAARGGAVGASALLGSGSLASIVGAATLGGLVGASWGLVEPSVSVNQHSVLFVTRVIPLAAIGAVIGAMITSAPRRR
jgi:hypothetical protein